MGVCDIFTKFPSAAERDAALPSLLQSLPNLVPPRQDPSVDVTGMLFQMLALGGTPVERRNENNKEDLWAPGGFVPDRKYADIAAAMWPLRFGQERENLYRSCRASASMTSSQANEALHASLQRSDNPGGVREIQVHRLLQAHRERLTCARTGSLVTSINPRAATRLPSPTGTATAEEAKFPPQATLLRVQRYVGGIELWRIKSVGTDAGAEDRGEEVQAQQRPEVQGEPAVARAGDGAAESHYDAEP
eukprot:768622-Hanusia_phi.AAC.3